MGTLRNICDIIPVGHNSFTRLDLLDETPLYSRPKKHLPNMPPKNTLADAWDDDWESLADVHVPLSPESDRSYLVEKPAEEQPKPKLTKAQLKAQHAELNKQLWQAA